MQAAPTPEVHPVANEGRPLDGPVEGGVGRGMQADRKNRTILGVYLAWAFTKKFLREATRLPQSKVGLLYLAGD